MEEFSEDNNGTGVYLGEKTSRRLDSIVVFAIHRGKESR